MGKSPLWVIHLKIMFYRERIWDNQQCTWQGIVLNKPQPKLRDLNQTKVKNISFAGARHEQLQRRAQLALEILLEEKKKGDDLGDMEKKEFKPKYDAKRLEDYGAKPDESF